MESQVVPTNSEAAILARILENEEQKLTADAAQYLLSRKFPESDAERVDELSAKARAGSLTEDESRELDNYLRVASLLAVMHSQARRSAKRADPAKAH